MDNLRKSCNKKTTTVRSGGISFCGVLSIVFITLRLLDKIDWAWYWLIAPLWIPTAAFIAFVLVCFIISFIIGVIQYLIER